MPETSRIGNTRVSKIDKFMEFMYSERIHPVTRSTLDGDSSMKNNEAGKANTKPCGLQVDLQKEIPRK